MRKPELIFILTLLLIASAFADNPSDSMVLRAYKDMLPSAALGFEVSISTQATVDGETPKGELELFTSSGSYEIPIPDSQTSEFAGAMILEVGTNLRTPITVSLELSCLIAADEYSSSAPRYIPLRWELTTSTASEWTETYVSQGGVDDHTSGTSYAFYDLDGHIYRYKLDISPESSSVEISSRPGTTVNMIFSPEAEIADTPAEGVNPVWTEATSFTGSGNVLPGFYADCNVKLRGTVNLNLNLANMTFKDFPWNMRYSCTVKVTVEGE